MYNDTLRDKWQLFTLVEGAPEFLLHSRRFLFFIIFIYFYWMTHETEKAVNFNKNKNSPTVTKIKGFHKYTKKQQQNWQDQTHKTYSEG